MMKRSLAVAVLAAAAVGFAAPAWAGDDHSDHTRSCPAATADNQRAATTTLVNRPDSGNHDSGATTWALDSMKRTVTITCVAPVTPAPVPLKPGEVAPAGQAAQWRYHAVLSDVGTFVTNGAPALSPQAGKPLRAGVHGTMSGGFTIDFTAAAHWSTYSNLYGGRTYSGTAPASSSTWVANLFSDYGQQKAIGDNWAWKYVTNCQDNDLTGNYGEHWADANPSAGSTPADGDITGAFLRKCCKPVTASPTPASPSPSASTGSPSAPASPSQSATDTSSPSPTGVVLVGNGSSSGSLPVTGTPLGLIAGAAALLLAAGLALLVMVRRRRAG